MSEFRQAIAYVDALEAHLALLQDSVASATVVGAIEDNLSFILEAVNGDVDMIMEKFRARCSMVDPVTNQPRFGPKMLAKVQDMLRRYDDVKVAVEDEAPLRLQAEGKIKELSEHQLAIEQGKIAREKKEEEARKATERARAEELKLLEQKQKAREAELQHQEQLRVEALAVAANKKREGREKERAELERQRLAAEEERKRVNASISHGKEGLEKAIAMLRDSTGSEALFRQSLGKLLLVVSNICSSPENTAFRHIPKDNANFHTDLGQYTGGHQCLLALGFRELQQGDETQPRAVFILEEPDLSEDFDAWSNWFDGLKDMKNLVESKL